MKADPQKQHEWLKRLVGEWDYQVEPLAGPGEPACKLSGNETVRMLGDLWVVCESKGEMPDGGIARMMMTLGYDPAKERYVGTWVGSMMPFMWVYEGSLDRSGDRLPLNAEGPDFTEPGKVRSYQDIIEIKGPGERTLTSEMRMDDGSWKRFMTATYRRKA